MEGIVVIIPAYNEEASIGAVLNDIPADMVREVIVVDNASTDRTAEMAELEGATVLREPVRGYGSACLKGLEYIEGLKVKPQIVVFIDGDYADHPEEMGALVRPIRENKCDMVIGSRTRGESETGALLPQAVFGNWLATRLIKLFHGADYSDLGPFRAIRYDKLLGLGMEDTNFGWTVEMQVKAARNGTSWCEVPVKYRRRIGQSKVTGTLKGTVLAGYKILYTIFKYSV